MVLKIILFLSITLHLYSDTNINKTYYIKTREIKLSDIVTDSTQDLLLYNISTAKHSRKIKSKDLIKLLKQNGYEDYRSKHRYTTFILKSPINISKIEKKLKNYYQNEYPNIDIKELQVAPRSYLNHLDDNYSVIFKNNSFLRNRGILSIKTTANKKIFFNYEIQASVEVYKSKKKIKKDSELSVINLRKERVLLDKFRAKPIQNITKVLYQTKHQIKKDRVLTMRDVTTLNIVKRNSNISIRLRSNNMAISFSAKALQDGKLNDIIKVQKSNGKRLKVKVTGRNMAEMQ